MLPTLTKPIMKKISYLLLALSLGMFSCDNDDDMGTGGSTDNKGYGDVTLHIQNFIDDEAFALGTDYIVASGDTINVTTLKYFVSNVELISEDTTYMVPESYYLVDGAEKMVTIEDVPAGTYTGIKFALGVDSTANHNSDHDKADLDPVISDGMIWNWATGYKFIKFEGAFKGDTTGNFVFHVGKDENYREFHFSNDGSSMEHMNHKVSSMELPTSIMVMDGGSKKVHIKANWLEFFENPTTIDLDDFNTSHGAKATTLVENYESSLFSIHHVE